MTDATVAAPRPRAELLRRRSLRRAWLCVAVGVLIPFVALIGARIGWSWHRAEGGGQLPLVIGGSAVFIARITLVLVGHQW